MNVEKICYGCGACLQTELSNEAGYVPIEKLTTDVAKIMCQRCFKLAHYGFISAENRELKSSLEHFADLRAQDVLIVYVVDIFDYLGSEIPNLSSIIGQNELILVANKVDILPKSVKKQKLIAWLAKQTKKNNLYPVAVELVSAKTGAGIASVLGKIEMLRKNKDVYVIGVANVGKSFFLNTLVKIQQGKVNLHSQLTTSVYAGTTLRPLKLPLDEKNFLIDTPGFINERQLTYGMSKRSLDAVLPKKELKVRTYQLNAKQSLLFGGCARIDFNKGARNSFSCYISNDIDIHRTKLNNATNFYEKHLGTLLTPPNKAELATFPKLVEHNFFLKKKNVDLVFSGLGWVAVAGAEAAVTVYAPQGVDVLLRDAII